MTSGAVTILPGKGGKGLDVSRVVVEDSVRSIVTRSINRRAEDSKKGKGEQEVNHSYTHRALPHDDHGCRQDPGITWCIFFSLQHSSGGFIPL